MAEGFFDLPAEIRKMILEFTFCEARLRYTNGISGWWPWRQRMITVQRLLVSKAWFIEAHPAMLAAAQLHITSTLNRCKTLTDVPHIKTSFMPVIRHLFIDVQQVKTSKLWFRQYERTFRSMPQLSTLELEYTPALPRKYIRTVFKVVDVDDECNPDEKGIKHIQQFASDLVMKKRHIPYSQGLEVMVNLWIELEKAFHLIIRSRMEARRPADSAGVTSATWLTRTGLNDESMALLDGKGKIFMTIHHPDLPV